MVFDLGGKTVGDFEGGKFAEAGKAYVADILGWQTWTSPGGTKFFQLNVRPEGFPAPKVEDRITLKMGDNFNKTLGKLTSNIVKSNAGMEGMLSNTQVDPDQFIGKKVGVVYMPEKDSKTDYQEWSLFLKVAFGISTGDVAEYTPNSEQQAEIEDYLEWKKNRKNEEDAWDKGGQQGGQQQQFQQQPFNNGGQFQQPQQQTFAGFNS